MGSHQSKKLYTFSDKKCINKEKECVKNKEDEQYVKVFIEHPKRGLPKVRTQVS